MKAARSFVYLLVFGSLLLPAIVRAGEKQYPVQGTVTALGTNQETTGMDKTLSTHKHRTYTVKVPGRILVLQCPNDMDNLLGKRECGGKKVIGLGDTLRMRVNDRYAYILTDNGKEQRLAVLSQSMNEEPPETTKKP